MRYLVAFLTGLFLAGGVFAQYTKDGFYEPDNSTFSPGRLNLLLNAVVKADNHWSDRKPELAVDGRVDAANDHWAGLNLPVSMTADMNKVLDVDTVRIVLFWSDGRVYKYYIEGSVDGTGWTELVNARDNKNKAASDGFVHKFPSRKIRYIKTTITDSTKRENGGHIVEIEAYGGSQLEEKAVQVNTTVSLNGSVASIDRHYERDKVPDLSGGKLWKGVSWAGERLNGQLVLWAEGDVGTLTLKTTKLKGSKLNMDGDSMKARFVRYVRAQGNIIPDVIETEQTIPVPTGSTRPVWLSIDVPRDAKAGLYKGQVTASPARGNDITFDIELEVLPLVVPPSADWPFHLDLWQNPYSVARYHGVELWSKEHFDRMRPLYEMLADAGQKCITVSLLHHPWGAQTHDAFDAMIGWTKNADGTWNYDYTVFDKYVEFVDSTGIKKQINCYTMIPWGNTFYYFDKSKGETVSFKSSPGTEEYQDHWRPFLKAFVKHLKEKGWLDRTAIAMDERPHDVMVKLLAFMAETAPELKIASAINYAKKEGSSDLYDISVAIGHASSIDRDYLESRTSKGQKTTFYVCCGPARPNTFPHSPPIESAWQGLHASALHYSGFLRWAYCSWVQDPLMDTKHPIRNWPDGDCFMVYPGPRTSIRFERLREGIVVYEKIRLLRKMVEKSGDQKAKTVLAELDKLLENCTYKNSLTPTGVSDHVNGANVFIEKLSRILANK